MYDHYVPGARRRDHSRSEFLTPYTPYQPEISQGGLQAMFEFQTAMSELTGLPVSNAALYEGPSAVASAAYLAIGATGRTKLVASRGVHPHSRESLVTYGAGYGTELVEVPLADGVTDAAALAEADRRGHRRRLPAAAELPRRGRGHRGARRARPKEVGALVVVACDPIALSVLKPPGECGADVAVGEGQPLGNRLDYGGPSFGFFCATEEHIRRMPGRIAGETTDVDGRRGFVLTLQTREQHIRREKATHNICTAQALNALAGMIHLSWLGKRGFVELGELLVRRTAYARETLAAVDGVELLHEAPVVREFARPARRAGRPRCSSAAPPRASAPATRSAASTPSTRTACWSRSPSAAAAPTSTASPRCSAAPSRTLAPRAPRSPRRWRRERQPPDRRRPPPPGRTRRRCSATARRRSSSARSRAAAPRRSPTPTSPRRRSTS